MRKLLIYAIWSCGVLGSLQIDIAPPHTKLACVRYCLQRGRKLTLLTVIDTFNRAENKSTNTVDCFQLMAFQLMAHKRQHC